MGDFFRYLPPDGAEERWGIGLRAGGRTQVAAGQAYPPNGHPTDHDMPSQGRVLPTWQLVWIPSGRGVLWNAVAGDCPVAAGSLFVLHPGVRHRFAPAPASGWSEWWLELDGPLVAAAGLDPARPVIDLGGDVVVADAMTRAIALLETQPAEFRPELGAWAHVVLARLGAIVRAPRTPHPGVSRSVLALQASPQRPWTVAGMARLAGLSPARFREVFHRHAGCSPRDYLITLRLGLMRTLLADPQRSVAEASRLAGFADPFYASRLFRARCGASPAQWRARG